MRTRSKAAMHRFKEAVELSPNSPQVLIRSARGLMKLPSDLIDLKFVKECIDKALELAPDDPMVHLVRGMYHEKFDCDADLTLEEYEKAALQGSFAADLNIVRINHILQHDNIVEELDTLAAKYEQSDRRQAIYTQAGSYLLFIKKDVIGALKYCLKAIELNPKPNAMLYHKPMFIHMNDPVNMFDVLTEEIASKDVTRLAAEDRLVVRTFCIKKFLAGDQAFKKLPKSNGNPSRDSSNSSIPSACSFEEISSQDSE